MGRRRLLEMEDGSSFARRLALTADKPNEDSMLVFASLLRRLSATMLDARESKNKKTMEEEFVQSNEGRHMTIGRWRSGREGEEGIM